MNRSYARGQKLRACRSKSSALPCCCTPPEPARINASTAPSNRCSCEEGGREKGVGDNPDLALALLRGRGERGQHLCHGLNAEGK
eukprot:6197323-Pleurochrysis_carterae.AAC.3